MSSHGSASCHHSHNDCQPRCQVDDCAEWIACTPCAARTRLSHRAFRGETWPWKMTLLVEPVLGGHGIEGFVGNWEKGAASHSEKGAQMVLCVAEAEGITRVKKGKHKRPVSGGVQDHTGSEDQRWINSTRRGRQVSRPRSHCVLLRMLTRRIGHSQLLWDTATKDCMGIAAGRYCAIGEGFLGRRAGEFEPRVQTTANLFKPQG